MNKWIETKRKIEKLSWAATIFFAAKKSWKKPQTERNWRFEIGLTNFSIMFVFIFTSDHERDSARVGSLTPVDNE